MIRCHFLRERLLQHHLEERLIADCIVRIQLKLLPKLPNLSVGDRNADAFDTVPELPKAAASPSISIKEVKRSSFGLVALA